MRLLFVNNYYPPHYVGGYELQCAAMADWLAGRGHRVRVLTSDYRDPEKIATSDSGKAEVRRVLELRYWTDVGDAAYWRREWRDLARFRSELRAYRPELVVLWNPAKLAQGLVLEAQRSAPALCHHLCDDWAANFREANGLPQFWARPALSPAGRLAKPPLAALYRALFTPDAAAWRPRHAALISHQLVQLMAERGIEFERHHVCFTTYDRERFEGLAQARQPDADGRLRLLWAGRLCAEKGLFTTLEALERLHDSHPGRWRIDFCGPLEPGEQAERFREWLAQAAWADAVRVRGPQPFEAMPAAYADSDVFLFTSEIHEGMPCVLAEAMAAGLATVGTRTGGSRDLLFQEQNALCYPMGDAGALAGALGRLIDDAPLRRSLAGAARTFAAEHCEKEKVFAETERFYASLTSQGRHQSPR